MNQFLALTLVALFTSCVPEFTLKETKVYGRSHYGKVPTYSEKEQKKDLESFLKNYHYYGTMPESERSFSNAPDYLFLNKFLSRIEQYKDKYASPYRVLGKGKQIFRTDSLNELNALQTRIREQIISIRLGKREKLPLGGQYGFYKKQLMNTLYLSGDLDFKKLNLAVLETLQQEKSSAAPENFIRDLDGLVHNIPLSFSAEYFKLSLDSNLEENWKSPVRTTASLNYPEFFRQGKGHPHLMALNFLLAHRRFKNSEDYQLEHPLVIFDKEHILPAFARFRHGQFEIQAILPYARGKGIINYGKSRDLNDSLKILTVDDFLYTYVFQKNFSKKNLEKTLVAAQNKAAVLYGLTKIKTWNNSASQIYLKHQTSLLPQVQPLITEISAKDWYQWLNNHSNKRKLASDFSLSQ